VLRGDATRNRTARDDRTGEIAHAQTQTELLAAIDEILNAAVRRASVGIAPSA
jgi:hypothetical protein